MTEEKAFLDRQKDLLEIIQLIEKFKKKYNGNIKDILKLIELSEKINLNVIETNKVQLIRLTLIKLETKFGNKLIPIKEIIKELKNRMENEEILGILDNLTISGDIYHPKKDFVQRM